MLIAGDIGATKTLLGLYHPEKGPVSRLPKRNFAAAIFLI